MVTEIQDRLNENRPYMIFELIKGYDREELIRIVNNRPKEELIKTCNI